MWQKNIGDGDHQQRKVNKGSLVGSGDGMLGIHRQVLAIDNAHTCTKNKQGNVGDSGIDVVFLEMHLNVGDGLTLSSWKNTQSTSHGV